MAKETKTKKGMGYDIKPALEAIRQKRLQGVCIFGNP